MSLHTIPDVRERFAAYHAEHLAWGNLHIVLDDGNVADADVEFCVKAAFDAGDFEGHALALILLQMSKTQRRKLGRSA